MSAIFTYAVKYDVTGTCLSPLRTGGTDGDMETVLRDRQGHPFIQGTSLAGALRDWVSRHYPRETVSKLFGSMAQDKKLISGKLIVSDAFFMGEPEQESRPRLRIDSQMGTAADHGKFDVAHIPTGSSFSLTLFWLGKAEDTAELNAVEAMLSAVDTGQILLGAQKSNGFGRVSLKALRRDFDMFRRDDREAWIAEAKGDPIELPAIPSEEGVRFTVYGKAESILIRAASARQSEKGSILENITEGGFPVLPGSSVKGAVRGRAELIARSAGLDKQIVEKLFGREAAEQDNGKAGQVRFEDVRLTGGNRQEITRIRINKFTGGVMGGGLFKEEPVSAPVALTAEAPEDDMSCALLLFAFRDLGLKLYNLGSGGSIGRGYISVERIEAESSDGRRLTLSFEGPMGCRLDDPDSLAAEWMKAWEVR